MSSDALASPSSPGSLTDSDSSSEHSGVVTLPPAAPPPPPLNDYDMIPSENDAAQSADNTGTTAPTTDDGEPEIKITYPDFESDIPQKIVICLDVTKELAKPTLKSKDGTKYSYLEVVKSLVVKFVRLCSSSADEFSLVFFDTAPRTVVGFTRKVEDIIRPVNELDVTKLHDVGDTFNVSQLFELNEPVIDMSVVSTPPDIHTPPEYMVRYVILYARDDCIPDIVNTNLQQQIRLSPFYFVDVLYLHGAMSDDNSKYMCETIGSKLVELDSKQRSYMGMCGPDITQLHNKMVQYIGHPLYRPVRLRGHGGGGHNISPAAV